MHARRLALGLVCFAAGCGSRTALDCNVRCDAQGGCPSDRICQLGICVPPGEDARRCPGAAVGGSGGDSTASASGSAGASSSSSGSSASSGSGSAGSGSSGAASASGTSAGSSAASTGGSSAGSTGSSGGTGSCTGPFGVAQQPVQSCLPFAPNLSPFSTVALGRMPDSKSDCAAVGSCAGTGTDADFAYPMSAICDDGPRTEAGVGPVGFSYDTTTRLSWENELVSSSNFTTARSRCAAANWSGARGQVRLPSAIELISLLDLSGSAAARGAGLTPAGLSFDPNGNWASDDPGTGQRFIVDFTVGEFYPEDPANNSVDGHCIDAADPGTVTLTDACTTLASPAGEECQLLVNGLNATGLTFFSPLQPQAMTWSEALAYCASLPPCGRYRLPSFKELATLVNFGSTATGTFIDALSGDVWTSTEAVRAEGSGAPAQEAERIYFQPPHGVQSNNSKGGPTLKTAQLYVGCVRGP